MKGVQWMLWLPMADVVRLVIMDTPFSTRTCTLPGRFSIFLPSRINAVQRMSVTIKEDTVVCVMGMPPKMGMVK